MPSPRRTSAASHPVTRTDRVATYNKLSGQGRWHSWLERIVYEVLDPETDLVLRQSGRRDPYLEMRWRDHEVASAYEQLIGPIVAAPWRVVPPQGQDDPDVIDAAEEITKDIQQSPGFPEVLRILGEIPFRGWGAVELNGRFGGLGDVTAGEALIPDDPEHRPSEPPAFNITFEAESGLPRLLTEAHPYWGVPLTQHKWRHKFLFGTWGSTEGSNWRGSGLGLRVWALHAASRKLFADWASAAERKAEPTRVGTITDDEYLTHRNRFKQILLDSANGDDMVIPASHTVTELGDKASFAGFKEFYDALVAAIHKAIVGQTLTMEQGERGAFALGAIHAEQLTERQWTVIQAMQRWLRPLVQWVCEMRYGVDHRLVIEPIFEDKADEQVTLQRLEFAATHGVPMLRDEVYQKLHATVPPEPDTAGEERADLMFTEPSGGAGDLGQVAQGWSHLARFAEGRKAAHPRTVAAEQRAVEDVVKGVTRGSAAVIEDLIPTLKRRLASGKRPGADVPAPDGR